MKSREVRVEVEPLSDARWSRIERSLFDQLDREERPAAPPARGRRWRTAVLVLSGAAAAAMGGLATASWLRAGSQVAVAPSHIETGASASHVALGEAALDVGPRSGVIWSGDDERGVLIVLDHGRVECEVAPRRGRPPFVVQAGDVRVRVVGTHFAVTREDGAARVEVSHGIVEVASHGEVSQVRAGETWPAVAPAAPPADPMAAPAAPIANERDDAAEISAPRRTVRAPHPRRPRPGAPPTAAPAVDDENETPPAPPPSAPTAAPSPPRPSPQATYEAAARIEKSDPAGALARYRETARGGDAWAANALYAAGRLEAERGARDAARRSLEEYLRRFPTGPNAGDARELLDRLRAR